MIPHSPDKYLEPGHALQDLEEKDPIEDAEDIQERRIEQVTGAPGNVRHESAPLSDDLLKQIYGCYPSSGCR